MADNFNVKDAGGTNTIIRTTNTAGVHVAHNHAHLMVANAAATNSNPVPALVMNGNNVVISVTPTLSATPDYAQDDVLGGLMTIQNATRVAAGGGTLKAITVSSKVAAGNVRVIFFKSNPSATTFTDNAVLALNTADYDKVLAHFDITDWADLGTPDIGTKTTELPFQLASGSNLYAVAVARATLNIESTSDLTFNFGIKQD